MQSTPDPSSALLGSKKGARARSKVVKDPVETPSSPEVRSSPETQSAAVKKTRAPRKTPTAPAALTALADTTVVAATLEPSSQDVDTMIATAAYYLAAARNFTPGHELDDWLTAERAVHARLYG